MADEPRTPQPPADEGRDALIGSGQESFRKSWDQVENGPTMLAEPDAARPDGMSLVSDTTGQPVGEISNPVVTDE